jgi:hypothetical protein
VKSFESLEAIWLPKLRAFGHENMLLILIANKVDDNNKQNRAITSEMATAFAKKYSMDYIEVSALTGNNVDVAFRRLILSAASILPDVKVHLDVIGLPSGWMKSRNDDINTNSKSKYVYTNYWKNTTTLEEPTAPAEHGLIYEISKKEYPTIYTCRSSSASSTRSSFINRIEEPSKEHGTSLAEKYVDTSNVEIGFGNKKKVTRKMNCLCNIL